MKTIKICSKNYILKFNKKTGAAEFTTAKEHDGRGEIVIGTKYRSLDYQATHVIHETLEAILTEDDKRFYNFTSSHERANFIFLFDHDYLCSLEHKLFDALISSGFFKLVDGKK